MITHNENLYTLTPRQAQVARLAADGKHNPQIAAELGISKETVKSHLRDVFQVLYINSRKEIAWALRAGQSGELYE